MRDAKALGRREQQASEAVRGKKIDRILALSLVVGSLGKRYLISSRLDLQIGRGDGDGESHSSSSSALILFPRS